MPSEAAGMCANGSDLPRNEVLGLDSERVPDGTGRGVPLTGALWVTKRRI